MDAPVLEMRGITKAFPGVRALDSVDIALYPGRVTALIGENGAGKSTLVKILTGIYQQDEGEIFIDGAPVRLATAQDATDTGVTAIHQETVLFDELSVGENIYLGHAPRTKLGLVNWKAVYARSQALLSSLETTVDARARLKELSIAQRHIVAIARALAPSPRVLLCDEPTSALDPELSAEVVEVLGRLASEGTTMVIATHDLRLASRIANEVVFLEAGNVVESGPARQVFTEPKQDRTRRFISTINAANTV